MKQHTQDFKDQISLLGKQQEVQIIYTIENEEHILMSEEINSATPSYEGDLLKSVMKQLEIDSNINIPLNTEIQFKYGLLVNGEYEYLDFGNYIVYSSEKQEDTNSYIITCYDKLLYSMKDYENLDIAYPISIRDYINTICNHLGLVFANKEEEFANYDKLISSEIYLDNESNSLGYTFRDVLDELAQVTASVICINENDKLEIRYINDTSDIIDEEYLKDVNVNFGKKYGKINSIVLSRSAESDNVYLRDEKSVEENGLCELKIVDNQIMNFNNRSDYLQDILDKLNGIEYYINDFTSTGIMYYDLLDMYNVKIGENTYKCLMLNDECDITQGLEELIHTDEPETSETDYTKADKTDRRIKQAYIIVDKANQQINAAVEEVGQYNERISELEIDVDSINQKISNISDFTREVTSKNELHLTETAEGQGYVLEFQLKGSTNNFIYLTPSDTLVPSNTLVPLGGKFNIVIDKQNRGEISNEAIVTEIIMDEPLRDYLGVYDELDIKDNKITVTRRIGVKEDLSLYVLENEIIEDYGEFNFTTFEGDTYIYIKEYYNLEYYAKYIIKNDYLDVFATKVDLNSAITQTADEINLSVSELKETVNENIEDISKLTIKSNEISSEVSKKVGEDEVISKINQSAEQISIEAEKISLSGKTLNLADDMAIKSNNFNVDSEGNMTCNNATVLGGRLSLNDNPSTGDAMFEIKSSDGEAKIFSDSIQINPSDGTSVSIRKWNKYK